MVRSITKYDTLVNYVYLLLLSLSHNIFCKRQVIVKEKGIANFVTNLDIEVEKALISELQKIENVPCISEESIKTVECSNYWVIDPIDGTTNLIHKYPSYCISIAKVENNVTKYGFVYNIATEELFVSIKGHGSYLIDTRSGKECKIFVSDICELHDSLIGFGFPYDKQKVDSLLMVSNKIIRICHDLKRNGPASLDICYVACGRLDGYYEYDLNEWDYRAASLILEEAGGKVTNWCGESIQRGTSSIVATNGKLHKELVSYFV